MDVPRYRQVLKALSGAQVLQGRLQSIEEMGFHARMQTEFEIATDGPGLIDFTAEVSDWVVGQGDGLLTLLILHTSASILIQENADPAVQTDLRAYFDRLVPPSDDPAMSYLRHTTEGPDDMPAHIKAAMMPVSLSIPVRQGRLVLGTWQGIYLVEHRTRPRHRRVAAHFRPDRPA